MKTLLLALVLLSAFSAPAVFAQSISKAQGLARETGEGGTNAGGGPEMVKKSVLWSTDLSQNLVQIQTDGNDFWEAGSYELALSRLREGIETVLSSATLPEQRLGIGYRNLKRLLALSTRFDSLQATQNGQKAVYQLFFDTLTGQAKFDRETYIAHAVNSKDVPVDQAKLADGLKSYASNVLGRAQKSFTFGKAPYANFGSEALYLGVMAAVTQGLAEDLRNSPLHEASLALDKIKTAIDSELGRIEAGADKGEAVIKVSLLINNFRKGL